MKPLNFVYDSVLNDKAIVLLSELFELAYEEINDIGATIQEGGKASMEDLPKWAKKLIDVESEMFLLKQGEEVKFYIDSEMKKAKVVGYDKNGIWTLQIGSEIHLVPIEKIYK